ncbi:MULTISPECIES: dipeptide epimerase [Flavobacteriaceae]|uniref:Dipeptide epimerase n=2 Tax=Flavobacteriaceae TaxID=49546 RepID=A0A4Y8AT92_9FLAO|nr:MULTISPECIES: dipeptide epimerase [Flavobacteriaceae]TEW75094.1 dipeptide epimerase [Gramella jeungdoensis]GGK41660.1 dipeptide epimerase [Lutibacter litoralis]
MKLIIHTFKLKLRHPFTISRGTRTEIPSIIVELSHNGKSGFGEATANPYYNTTVEKFEEELIENHKIIEAFSNQTPEEYWTYLLPYFANNMFLLCALDEAYNDLYSRLKNLKLYEYWNFKPENMPLTNYTIGIDSVEKMTSKMKEVPWPIYKIKLGTKDDIQIVTELRKHSNSIFRIDANCGWDVTETVKNSVELKKLGVEFIEQPLPVDNWKGAKVVYENSHLPIIADESCIVETDVEKCYNHFHGINVKLMKCGGLTPAKRMITKAKSLGLKTMIGCMTESSVGISAIAHLTPLLDYVDMDGALLLKNDIAKGVTLNNGNIVFSKLNGTGVLLNK